MTEPVYEMLWDCRHCGARKLLGLTHRYCPNCGSPQAGDQRYFPSDAEKIAVTDHIYHGADVVCRYCGHYNGKNARHCKDCGGPLAEGTAAALKAEPVPAGAAPPNAKAKKKRSLLPIVLVVAASLLAIVLTVVFWKREASFIVAGHRWQRDIDIERFGPVEKTAWCDELPSGAKNVQKRRAVRSHRQVEVGEDCQTRKVDNGDGTFRETQECTPRFEKQPVEDDRCKFTLDAWSKSRTLTSQGEALSPAPSWPAVELARPGCKAPGCEREGARRESYTVVFQNAQEGDTGECQFDEARWRSFAPSASFAAQVGVIGGWLDCDTLSGK